MKILKTAIAAAFVAATIADPAVADPIQWSSGTGGNDHYYEAIRGANFINWEDAGAAAAAKGYLGMQGYLVPITSEAENAFITANFNPDWGDIHPSYWIGASDSGEEGVWKWMTGPEAGTQFWQGNALGSTTGPFNYANWLADEPNDWISGGGEDYALIAFNGSPVGAWADVPLNAYDQFSRSYVVEYGAPPIPERGSYAMLLAGLGLLGFAARRRKLKETASA